MEGSFKAKVCSCLLKQIPMKYSCKTVSIYHCISVLAKFCGRLLVSFLIASEVSWRLITFQLRTGKLSAKALFSAKPHLESMEQFSKSVPT